MKWALSMTETQDGLPPLRDVIRDYGLAAQKSLGQNFLLDLNLTRKIARVAMPLEEATIIEIGPGPGGLTRALLMEGARHVIVVEKDVRCQPILEEISAAYPGRVTIKMGDALHISWPELLAAHTGPFRIVANLPYNVGTPLLIHWLSQQPWPPFYDRMVLMFQREVAQRIVARTGEDHYGRLAVLSQWLSEPDIVFDVHPSAFTPPPKVTSSVVRLIPRAVPLSCSLKKLETVTRAAFGQRRKMLRQSLKSVFPDPQAVCADVGLVPTMRAEEVPLSAFLALAQRLG
jgi:16S rRNA (adenine1518-N6/adenine1519-N6)-dimethyltransferase